MPRIVKPLRLPQVRVLQTLKDGGLLSRNKIGERAGFSAGSGTLNYALNGMKQSKANLRPHPGLVTMGLVIIEELDIDGLVEQCYRITQTGKEALADWLEKHGALPELRDRQTSTNLRYKE